VEVARRIFSHSRMSLVEAKLGRMVDIAMAVAAEATVLFRPAFFLDKFGLVLQQLGLLQLAPQPSVTRFSGWWKRSTAAIP